MGKKENTKICQCLAGVIDVGINVSQKRWEHCSINRGGIGLQALNSRNLHFCFTSLLLAPISPLDIHYTDDPFETHIWNTALQHTKIQRFPVLPPNWMCCMDRISFFQHKKDQVQCVVSVQKAYKDIWIIDHFFQDVCNGPVVKATRQTSRSCQKAALRFFC